jgi:hypothetical protein
MSAKVENGNRDPPLRGQSNPRRGTSNAVVLRQFLLNASRFIAVSRRPQITDRRSCHGSEQSFCQASMSKSATDSLIFCPVDS